MMGQFGVGQPLRRVEDRRFLTGHGQYTDDIALDGQLYAVFVRSPFACAAITGIDTAEAKAAPGVHAVYTAEDLQKAGIGDIPCVAPVRQEGQPFHGHDRPVLARGHVRHAGDPVAAVVADSPDAAREAADLVDVNYDDRDAVVDTASALAPNAPQVWADAPDNTCFHWEHGSSRDETDAAFDKAAHVVSLDLINNRVVVNPMEPRAAIGSFEDGRYTLRTPSQGVHNLKNMLADTILNVPRENIHVITPDVGGGFGMKLFCHPEQPLVLFAAKDLGRPVKWTGERSADCFLSDSQGRDHVSHAELALDSDYNFLGLRVRTTANLGAYLSNFAPFIATLAGCRMLSGVYRIPAIHVEVTGVYTHTVPVDAYRGAGRPEAAYLVERLVDKAPRALAIDALDLRRRNFIQPDAFPYATPVGPTYDSGLFDRTLSQALDRADHAGFNARRQQSAAHGRKRGIGVAYYIEACGSGPGEQAEIRIDEDGTATLLIGTQSNGQGHETAYRQIVAGKLGLSMDRIAVVQGDSDRIEKGFGTGGSRSLTEGGTATRDAAEAVIEKGKRIAAELMEAAAFDIDYDDGIFRVTGTDKQRTLAEVAVAAQNPHYLPDDEAPGLDGKVFFKGGESTYPNGCHICELEVDPDTGAVEILRYTIVDDFGTVINPLLLAGQVHGGVAQGLGQALLEHTVYGPDSGQLLTGSLMDYALPRADHLPFIDFTYHEDAPCVNNPMGVKGAGEAGCIGAPPAIINALVDALQDYGVDHIDMPATPERVWRAIHETDT